MVSCDVTRRALAYGAADATTGAYAETYDESTIRGSIQPKGATPLGLPMGRQVRYGHTFYTKDIVYVGDQIKDVWNRYFRVEDVQFWNTGDRFEYRFCGCTEMTLREGDNAATSGTWHLDSESVKTDPRNRIKTWLDTYIADANILLADGATQATTHSMFAGSHIHLPSIFLTKALDGVFIIDKKQAEPLLATDKKPYSFIEDTQVFCYALDKSTVTGTNLVEQMEQEVRHVATDYPYGSIRSLESTEPKYIDVGGDLMLWETTVNIKYKRANDDYTPTAPVFDHGYAFTYEGDRLTGGAEGTWDVTNHKGDAADTYTINSENNLVITLTTANDTYTHNGTNLGLSTTTYTKVRWRYKTTSTTTAKIILEFSDASTQTVLSETASTTFTMGSATITTAKTLDHIRLYGCDAAGTAVFDFVEIYTGTYIIPNIVEMEPPEISKEAVIEIPGMSGDLTQSLGSGLLEVSMVCDTDVAPGALDWKRPQTTTHDSDKNNLDIFYETLHLGGIQVPWVWLDLGDPQMQFKARLVRVEPSYGGDKSMVRLTWREYRHGTAANETTSERFGLSL